MDAVDSWFESYMEQDNAYMAEGLRSGNPEVVQALIERYQHRLFRYLLSITNNRATAEDVFQETWLHVLERANQYRPQWKFEVWLFSIARHLVIDLARRKKSDSLDELMDPESRAGFEPRATGPSPFEELMAGEQSEQMSDILSGIPAVYREALTLRFQEDLELSEIAVIVKIPLATVKSRLYRGLETLRKRLEETPA
jgi:RNA polymerase sigma-70 factor (ECF subfamily)